MVDYIGTVPNYICQQTLASCNEANPGSPNCVTCGSLVPTDVKAETASTSAVSATSHAVASNSTAIGSPSMSPTMRAPTTPLSTLDAITTSSHTSSQSSPNVNPTTTDNPTGSSRATTVSSPHSGLVFSSAVKVSIALGVSLGIVIAGIIVYWALKRRAGLRHRPRGNDNTGKGHPNTVESETLAGCSVEHWVNGYPQELNEVNNDLPEIHGTDVRELVGSPSLQRQDLPHRRDSE